MSGVLPSEEPVEHVQWIQERYLNKVTFRESIIRADPSDFGAMTVAQLKAQLRLNHLPVHGLKQDLVERLIASTKPPPSSTVTSSRREQLARQLLYFFTLDSEEIVCLWKDKMEIEKRFQELPGKRRLRRNRLKEPVVKKKVLQTPKIKLVEK